MTPLGELTVRWTGSEDGEIEIHDEFEGAAAAGPDDGPRTPTTTTEETRDRATTPQETLAGRRRRAAPVARGDPDGGRPAARRGPAWPPRSATRSTRSRRRCTTLAEEYAEQGRGFELRNVAGGWRYYTREEYAAVVEGFVLEGQQARLTQAALETLAVVAYKQPVSRARVSAIRGVNVDGVMRTLLTRGLVEEAGQDDETGANLYRTTSYFLERIGITSPRRAARAGAVPPRQDDLATGRARGELALRAAEPWRPSRSRPAAPSPTDPTGHEPRRARRRRRRADPAPEAARPVGRRLAPQVRGADARGLVEVDGEVVTRLGTKVDPRTAVIRVDGKRLPPISPNVYLVLNKPRGVVSTMSDPEGRRTLADLVADRPERLFHVGRLDTDTSGLILLTNDGDFAQRHGAPVVRGGQDVRRRGRRRGHQGDPEAAARRRDPRGRPGDGLAGAGRPRARPSRSSSW